MPVAARGRLGFFPRRLFRRSIDRAARRVAGSFYKTDFVFDACFLALRRRWLSRANVH